MRGIRLFELTGRVAVITGGSKGLGLSMSKGLASAGASVVIVNRDDEQGRRASEEVANEYGVTAINIAADVTVESDVASMCSQVIDRFGRIDILINNAGINIRGRIDDLSTEDFQRVQDVNVLGTWLPSRYTVPHMKAAKRGKIINVASTLGLVGLADRTPYVSSKGAVVQMTRGLGLELAPHNIQVNAICPGPFLTEMNIPIADSEEAKNFIVGATALGRWGELEEIQGAALFLASDASNYMVGSMVTVDGGWTAR